MATYMITVQNTGQCFPCREDEFVLAAMQRAGNALVAYGCHGGGCGVCRARVIGGAYFAAKPMSRAHVSYDEEAKNAVLLCCIQPRGDMRIVRDE